MIVGDAYHSGAIVFAEGAQQFDHLFTMRPVQGAGGFIGKKQIGRFDQGAANGHPLFFTT